MIRNKKGILFVLSGLLLMISLIACKNDKWDVYENKPTYLKEGSLFNLLKDKPEFSEFMSLARKTGYDSILRRSDMFTVLAIKNGGFTTIDTSSSAVELKKIIGMHVIPKAIERTEMTSNRYIAISGKSVVFQTSGATTTAGGMVISSDSFKALNGLVYIIDRPILPLKNLKEIVESNPDFSLFKAFIDSSYTQSADPSRNVVTGYDPNNNPIYQQPIVYTKGSVYMDSVKLDDENTFSTLLIPPNQVINTALARLLTERAQQNGLIVPRVDATHPDTTIGYFFIPRNIPYPGDSAILTSHLFRNITRPAIPSFTPGEHALGKVTGGSLAINTSQLTSGTGGQASNGFYYILKEANLTEVSYRKVFILDTYIQNPASPAQFILNPNIKFSMGASSTIVTKAAVAWHNRAIEFNFNNLGGRIDFTLPLLTAGNYKVLLQYVPISSGAIVSASFGSTSLRQQLDVSVLFTRPEGENAISALDADLGTIHQSENGPATVTLKCTAYGPLNSAANKLEMCLIKFVPI